MRHVRVFIATSLDGFIAGADDDLSWLPPPGAGAEDTFTPFIAEIGAILMGRRTYDVARGFPGPWPYAVPVLVATSRALVDPPPDVQAITGPISELVERARQVAGSKDVYVDGGALIRAALDADLVDRATVTVVPVVLGAGVPLFAGATRRHPLELEGARPIGAGMVQLTYRTLRDAPDGDARARRASSA